MFHVWTRYRYNFFIFCILFISQFHESVNWFIERKKKKDVLFVAPFTSEVNKKKKKKEIDISPSTRSIFLFFFSVLYTNMERKKIGGKIERKKRKKTKRKKKNNSILDRNQWKIKKKYIHIWIDEKWGNIRSFQSLSRYNHDGKAGVARDGPRSNKPFRQCLLHTSLQLC